MPGSRDSVVLRPVHAIIEQTKRSGYTPSGQHQWQTYRSTSNPSPLFTVRAGTVYGESKTSVTTASHSFADPKSSGHVVWVKITVNSGTKQVTEAEIEDGPSIPADTDTLIHYELAKIVSAYPNGAWYSVADQTRWEPIYIGDEGGGTATICPFGTWRKASGTAGEIIGGPLYAGSDVHDVEAYNIDLGDRTKVVWISVEFTPREADGVLLSGIATSSAPTWNEEDSYPAQTIPTIESGYATPGTAIVAIGTITVTGDIIKFEPAGCGSITVHHCPGSIYHTRA